MQITPLTRAIIYSPEIDPVFFFWFCVFNHLDRKYRVQCFFYRGDASSKNASNRAFHCDFVGNRGALRTLFLGNLHGNLIKAYFCEWDHSYFSAISLRFLPPQKSPSHPIELSIFVAFLIHCEKPVYFPSSGGKKEDCNTLFSVTGIFPISWNNRHN